VLLAGSAATVYALAGHQPAAKHADRLSARVASVQTVGLATPGPAGGPGGTASDEDPELLLAAPHGLMFRAVRPADLPGGYPEWTADQMVGGGYIFIYIQTGRCLASGAGPVATLQRCDLSERQRWSREYYSTDSSGQQYWQLRNAADRRCLTAGARSATAAAAGSAAGSAAQLQRCGTGASWRQLIAFWSGY